MKKKILAVALIALISGVAMTLDAKSRKSTKAATEQVINTTEIGSKIRGYKGPVPVRITARNGKIVKVEPLPNHESPGYFNKLHQAGFFNRWNGMTLRQAANAQVDAVTGATYSSQAVIRNVQAAAKANGGAAARK